ncbi:MAG: SMP-30/gluconolactonase/LRE family protein [Steroidobacteraceae bacterium]
MSPEFTLVLDSRCALGESPVWRVDAGHLVFVDITGRRLHRFDPRSRRHDVEIVAEDIGCVAPAEGGGYVAGLRSGIWLLDASAGKVRQLAANPENATTNRFNDGRVDPRGRYLAGTLDEPKAGGCAGLYRYDRRGLAQLLDGVTTSNGLAFSPDGRILYFSDTPRFVIYRFDYDPDTGAAANRRVFARVEPTPTDRGRPDGAAVDMQGCYWSSLYAGSRVRRYDPDGKMMADYPVPALNPTMPAFGAEDMKTLFVTTARDKNGGPGGGLYAMPVDTPGLPGTLFSLQA